MSNIAPPLDVLYRDAQLAVVFKPSGLLVHRSALAAREERSALQALRDQLGQPVHAVHRLDRGASGLLVFALDRDAGRALSGQFERREVAKRYVALVRGHPPLAGRIAHALRRLRDDAEWKDPRATDAPQEAVTDYRRLATAEIPVRVDRYPTSRYALVSLAPLTGRRHQLRRHLKHIAHPIIGDANYGKGRHNRLFAQHYGCARLMLACTELSFAHPATGRPVKLEAALGGDWDAVLRGLDWRWDEPAGPPSPHG